jgi:single-strand DNA-binding protein
MSLNRIVVIGRLTKDPELRYTPAGKAVASMRIAVNRNVKNEAGEYDADFFDVVAWEQRAEFASRYLNKGRLIAVDGRLQTRSWVAQDGQKRVSFEIVAEHLEGLDRRVEGGENVGAENMGGHEAHADHSPAPAPRPAAPARNNAPAARVPTPAPIDDDTDEADPFADE